ncbi:lipopolysaccharide-responsive and beige-like anchor protein [Oncorhynchus nerka]|uniref:lipopolysaccharide-responsive and beige-like anchor protein n=1 Tax=Oncorhynchus nerka TaxID=8023 RepID=UPI0031B85C1C
MQQQQVLCRSVTFEQHKENLARMFRQYQRLGSEGDAARIRTISGASRDSEILGQLRTNRDQGEETAPSTVIELTIDPEGVPQNQESPNTTPPSETSTASASTPSPPEREGDRSQRGQAPITVSNMLARAEEEEELQQVQNQISEDQRGGAGDRAEVTTQETEAKLTGDKVSSKTVEAMAETETATDKTDEAAAASTAETDEATRPETEDAKVAKSETSDDATTSDTDKVVRPQTDGEKGSETHSRKASNVLMSEDSLNEPKEPELAKRPEGQVSAVISACQEGSVAEGSAVGASVQSVSDQVRPSSTDDSMEESSFVSAAGGEEEEKEEEEVKTEEVVVEEEKMEEVKAEEIKTEVKTGTEKEEESVAKVTKSAVESPATPPASVPEESQTQPPKMEEIDLNPSAPGTDPTSTEPAWQPLESTTSPPSALEAILPAAVGATVSKSDTPQAVAPAEAPSTKGFQPEAPQATEAPSSRTDTSPKVATATAVEAGKDSAAEGPGSATKTKEIHIARLDVSSVASDTERLALKETSTPEVPQGDAAGASGGQASESSSSARSTMFRIPEFRWSHMHQRLLTDLLFSIETDVQTWRSHSTKTVMDFVNSSENVVFVHNTVHLISQVVDNLIMSCGGILPLLSAATSSSHDLENIEPSQGLSVEASVTFLQRLINLVDVLIFASSLNFTEIEAEKNMSSGGILRQSLRLVCAMAVRNCLECQQQSHFKPSQDSARGQQAVHSLMGTAKSMPTQSPVDVVAGGMSPIRDMDRLLQEMDINRLRAVVFRDIEDSKQAQFLALAVVYFISVLMVSKYRDILEPQNDKKLPQRSQSARSADSNAVSGGPDLESSVSLRRRDSGIGDDHSSVAPSEADTTAQGPDAVSEALSTLSSEVRGHRDNPTADARGGKNVKDILRSLVSAPADDIMVDPSLLPPAFLGAAMGNNPNQFRSFDRSVRVAPKKVGGAPSPGSSTPVPSATAAVAATGTPVNNVAVVSTGDASQSTTAEAAAGSASANLPSVPTLSPMTRDTAPSMSISERLEHALDKAAPLLREIFVDFAPFLSRTLLGSHGQELLIEGTSLMCMKSSSSVVELVMLLCSQAENGERQDLEFNPGARHHYGYKSNTL